MKLKKIISYILIISMLFATGVSVNAKNEYKTFYGFEDQEGLSIIPRSGRCDVEDSEGRARIISYNTELSIENDPADGEKSLKIVPGSNASCYIRANELFNRDLSGKTLIFSIKVKAEGAAEPLQADLFSQTDQKIGQTISVPVGNGDFSHLKTLLAMPGGGVDLKEVYLRGFTPGTTYWLDSYLIEEKPEFDIDETVCNPAPDSENYEASDVITVGFTYDVSDLSAENFSVSDKTVMSVDARGNKAVLSLDSPLEDNTFYTVNIINAVDVDGRSLNASYSFKTLDKGFIPAITSVFPKNKSVEVSTDTELKITFDNPSVLPGGSVTLNGSDDLVSDIETADNKTFIVRLNELSNGTLYKVKISGAESIYGVRMDKDYEFSFYTKQAGVVIWEKDFEDGRLDDFGGYGTERSVTDAFKASGEYSAKVDTTIAYGTIESKKGLWNSETLYKVEYKAALDPSNAIHSQVAAAISYWGDAGSVQKKIGAVSPKRDGRFVKGESYFCVSGSAGDTIFYFYGDSKPGLGTFYIDDVKLIKMPELSMLDVSSPCSGETFGTTEDFEIVFNAPVEMPKTVLLNGEELADVSVSDSVIRIAHEALENDKSYKLEIKGITDIYGREADNAVINFKTKPMFTANDFTLSKSILEKGVLVAEIGSIANNTPFDCDLSIKLLLFKEGFMLDSSVNETFMISKGETLQQKRAAINIPDLNDGEYVLVAAIWKNDSSVMPILKNLVLKEAH